jgi:RNA polymerase sigma-70 factor (ECF subfamily)
VVALVDERPRWFVTGACHISALPFVNRVMTEIHIDTDELFRAQRRRLFSIAYRMLGTVSEAEDVVQEAFARYQRLDRAEVESPPALLTTMVTRIAIDQLRSARVQRERYVGEWLPEPIVGEADRLEVAESLSMAFLVLLESLSPVERAVFLLHEVFDYRYGEIAPIVGRTEEHCRQIAHRARRHVDARRPRFEPSAAARDALASRFFAACEDGDTEALLEMLAEDCVLYGDGGGKAPAFGHPLEGANKVARALAAFARIGADLGLRIELATVNGQPGARFMAPDGLLLNVVALDVAGDGRIHAVRSVANPDKLSHLGPLADAHALLAERVARMREAQASRR